MWQRPLVTGPIHLRFKNLSGKKGGGVSTSAVSSIYMKLRLPGNSEEIERRTSNAQDRTSIIDVHFFVNPLPLNNREGVHPFIILPLLPRFSSVLGRTAEMLLEN